MEPGRLRLYANLASPEGQLAAVIRLLLGLDEVIELSVISPNRDGPPTLAEGLNPVGPAIQTASALLWDQSERAVASEGLEVAIRMGTEESNDLLTSADGPAIAEIDRRLRATAEAAGFAADADAYAVAYAALFEALDDFDRRLGEVRFLHGRAEPTAADWWLFCVLLRFDLVYYGLYKCNRTRLVDFSNLHAYCCDLYQLTDVAETLDVEAIKQHHYWADARINPKRLYPRGRGPDLLMPHTRSAMTDPAELRRIGVEEDPSAQRRRGEWVRKVSRHRERITADGSSGYAAEPGRYHLYVSNNCPWCHRTNLTRSLEGLTDVISMDVLFYRRDPDRGWQFRPEEPGCTPDTLFGYRFIRELYERVGSDESSLPVLWDKHSETIISNESAEIIRMFNDAFGAFTDSELDLYPHKLRDQIDRLNAWIYRDVNNGAYKAGFSSSQEAYEEAYQRFFSALERLDGILAESRFLTGDALTEADVRLFPTIFRFDHVYYTRFRLNERMVRDYRHLYRWLREVLHYPGVAEASNLEHCKRGYFGRTGNNIVPIGPDLTFD